MYVKRKKCNCVTFILIIIISAYYWYICTLCGVKIIHIVQCIYVIYIINCTVQSKLIVVQNSCTSFIQNLFLILIIFMRYIFILWVFIIIIIKNLIHFYFICIWSRIQVILQCFFIGTIHIDHFRSFFLLTLTDQSFRQFGHTTETTMVQ